MKRLGSSVKKNGILIAMKNFFGVFLFIPFYFVWLTFCFFVSLLGLVLPRVRDKVEVETVKNSETICRILVRKKKITKANYEFEATQVSQYYDVNTFDGYMFIVRPVIWALQNHQFADQIVTFFVRRWIRVQKYQILKVGTQPPVAHILLTKICVRLAYGVGRVLNF